MNSINKSGTRGSTLTDRKPTTYTNPIAQVPWSYKHFSLQDRSAATTQEEDSLGQTGPHHASQSTTKNGTEGPTPKESPLDASTNKQEWMSLSRCVSAGPSKAGAVRELKVLTG